ncbi:ATP-dependent Clp protease proteolytic subunit [Coxiella endosymbiont of Rhipicephalus microplus]|nr:ATP-dependent Clp protease proteolytic subunit [Coxiella-like endosymbiont]
MSKVYNTYLRLLREQIILLIDEIEEHMSNLVIVQMLF